MTIQKRTLMTFGIDAQLIKLAEECGELVQAALKFRESKTQDLRLALAGELADVEILCEQMRLHFGDTDIDGIRMKKLSRLEARLNKAEELAAKAPAVAKNPGEKAPKIDHRGGSRKARSVKVGDLSFRSIILAAEYLGMSTANLGNKLRANDDGFDYMGVRITFEEAS